MWAAGPRVLPSRLGPNRRAIFGSACASSTATFSARKFPPFLLALGVFTFLMAINPMLEYAQRLIAKGVALPTVGLLLLTLVPSALSLTIPIGFLTGLLMALGRLSGDRESVALLACGVSPLRILRPVLARGDDRRGPRHVHADEGSSRTRTRSSARSLSSSWPRRAPPKSSRGSSSSSSRRRSCTSAEPTAGGRLVAGACVADTRDPFRPALVLAESGRLDVNRQASGTVGLILANATRYTPGKPGTTRLHHRPGGRRPRSRSPPSRSSAPVRSPDPRGFPEMGYAQLSGAG